jgi:hypothetical protein
MPDDAGVPDPTTGQTQMPPALNLSSAAIVPYGLYLLDDGVNQFLYVLCYSVKNEEANLVSWVGRDTVPALLADVFGVEDRTQLKQGKMSLPLLDNEYSERVRAGKSTFTDDDRRNMLSETQSLKSQETTSRRVWEASCFPSCTRSKKTAIPVSSCGRRHYLSKTELIRGRVLSNG